jgi:hypothetical protein
MGHDKAMIKGGLEAAASLALELTGSLVRCVPETGPGEGFFAVIV